MINDDWFGDLAFRGQFAALGGSGNFTIEDALHSEVVSEHATLDEAWDQLRKLSLIPWNAEPNKAPCEDWQTCGRDYVLNEYETSDVQRRPVRSTPIFDITKDGIMWHVDTEHPRSS